MHDIKPNALHVAISIVIIFTALNVYANDCSLFANQKAANRCMEEKLSDLKRQQNNTTHIIIPKGAVIDFNAKTCPNGWSEFKHQQKITDDKNELKVDADYTLIKCEKTT